MNFDRMMRRAYGMAEDKFAGFGYCLAALYLTNDNRNDAIELLQVEGKDSVRLRAIAKLTESNVDKIARALLTHHFTNSIGIVEGAEACDNDAPDAVGTIGPEGLRQLQYWRDGTAIIEKALAKAVAADLADVPFPLTGAAASLWHSASASAYQHALEMMGVPRIEPAKKVPT